MRLSMSFATLAALAASLTAGPAVVRQDLPPVLDDFSAAEASSPTPSELDGPDCL